MEKIDIIKAFTEYATHFQMKKPWTKDGSVRATNGHIALLVPEAAVPGHEFKPWEWDGVMKEIDIRRALPVEGRTFEPFDIASLEAAIEADKGKYAAVCTHPCPNCAGEDLVEGEECYICWGSEKIGYNREGKFVSHHDCRTSFLGKILNWNYLCTILEAMKVFGGSWEYSAMPQVGAPVIFRNGEVSIAIMERKA